MKDKLILGMTTVALAAAVGSYLHTRMGSKPTETSVSETVEPAAPARGEAAHEVDSEVAGEQIREGDRRRVLDELVQIEDPRLMLRALLAEVAQDPAPADLDPLVTYSSALLRDRFERDPDSFARAREVLLGESSEKQVWLLADALIEYSAREHAGSGGEGLRMSLAADLIDAYFRGGELARGRIIAGVTVLAGDDVGRVLADGPNVDLAALPIVAAARREQENAWAQLNDETEAAPD